MGHQTQFDRRLDSSDFRLLKLMIEDAAHEMNKAQLLELADVLHGAVRGVPAAAEDRTFGTPTTRPLPADTAPTSRWRFAPLPPTDAPARPLPYSGRAPTG